MIDKVMNCIEWDPRKFTKYGCVSDKEDGIRGFYFPGEPLLWSRSDKPIYGMEHIVDELKQQDTQWPIDMELVVPGLEFNESSGIIRNHDSSPEVQGHIIDVICKGSLVDRFKNRPVCFEHLHHIPHWKVQSIAAVIRKYNEAVVRGKEGIVWKPLSGPYKSARTWMRLVPIKSEDCLVTGVYEGKGKMEGIAGGIYIDFRGIPCKVGTLKDYTYNDRRALLETESLVGQTIRVEYKNLQPSGKPRQPRYRKGNIRWDK